MTIADAPQIKLPTRDCGLAGMQIPFAPFVEHCKATQDLGEHQPGSGVGAHQLGRYLSFGHLEKGFARTV